MRFPNLGGTLRRLVLAGLAAQIIVPLPLPAQEGLLNSAVLQQVVRGLFRPTSITHAGDGSGRLFVTEQSGSIRIVSGGRLLEEPFLDISSRMMCCGELGLLGLAFHPQFEQNGYFYVFYSDVDGASAVSRFQAEADRRIADPSSEVRMIKIAQPSPQHQGGQLHFGPDDFLYISVGDGGPAAPENTRAQERDTLLGKLLRIDVDGGDPYAVPASNPFVGDSNSRAEVWAYGLRNPWRFSFDRATGDLFVADVGFADREEINFQPAASRGGENYGWSVMEGGLCLNGDVDCNLLQSFTEPVMDYGHDVGCSVIGGSVYRGSALPNLQGLYLYGDFCSGEILAARRSGDGDWEVVDSRSTDFSITTFGEDESGEMYVANLGGEVYRIAPPATPASISFAYPSRAIAGGPAPRIYLVGADFVTGVEVRWNGELRPNLVLDNQSVRVDLTHNDIAVPGTAEITVENPSLAGQPARLEFRVEDPGLRSPRLNEGGIVTSAGFAPGALAPGSIAAVFGSDLAAFTEAPPRTPLPRMAGGAGLLFQGQYWAPLFFAAPLQLNVQIPWELAGLTQTTAQLRIGSEVSEQVSIALADHAPAVFVLPAIRPQQGAVLIGDAGGVVAAPEGAAARTQPLRAGQLITIYLTGLGSVSDQPDTGNPAGAFPLSETIVRPRVAVGGVAATVIFSGLAPGTVGLYQVNALTSSQTPSGDAIPVVVSMGGTASLPVVIAVE